MSLRTDLESHGLTIIDNRVPEGLWGTDCNSEAVDALSVFARLFHRTSLVPYVLGEEVLAIPDLMPGKEHPPLACKPIPSRVVRVARSHGHELVSEVHVFVAMLDLYPVEFEGQIARINQARAVPGRPMEQASAVEKAREYLSSRYYPFDAEQHAQFTRQKLTSPDLHNDVWVSLWFLAHHLRDEWRQIGAAEHSE